MRGIDRALVDEVWRDVTLYPPGRVEAEAAAFLGQQPHVAEFARAVTQELDESVQKAALGLAFLLFKILERSLGRPFPPVEPDRLAGAHEEVAEWLAQAAPDERAPLSSLDTGSHPSLTSHILSLLYRGDADPAEYDPDVRASLSLLLRTLTLALDIGPVEA